ncbi:hypothetical protein MHU86_19817 [Fragilaria crotonensis]|nr:hypothetical protein MHU86_19817 [Fragilaria crotonensis]
MEPFFAFLRDKSEDPKVKEDDPERAETVRLIPESQLPDADSSTNYASTQDPAIHKIRFQVVVWYVGPVDVVLGKVEMKFRVTIFWNTPTNFSRSDPVGYGLDNPWHKKVWAMHGRQRAFERNLSRIMDQGSRLVYVPPVSILNAVDLETVGDAEVCLIDEKIQLMKWTCLYKASLLQDDLQVPNFPHDEHDLVMRFGILKHRQPNKRWDRRKWKLALATVEDTLDTIHTPHGLIVDHVKVPGFSYTGGLKFEFVPLRYGMQGKDAAEDQCLQVKLRVHRDSSYYNCNIIPLLAMLNVVALSTMALDAEHFGSRGEMILATSFVEIGIRMTVDSRLPLVGYQIKIQVVLNHFFYGLVFLGLESSLVYVLHEKYGVDTSWIDRGAVMLELLHLLIALVYYYCFF